MSKLEKYNRTLAANVATLLDNQNKIDSDVQDVKAQVFGTKGLGQAFRGKRANRL